MFISVNILWDERDNREKEGLIALDQNNKPLFNRTSNNKLKLARKLARKINTVKLKKGAAKYSSKFGSYIIATSDKDGSQFKMPVRKNKDPRTKSFKAKCIYQNSLGEVCGHKVTKQDYNKGIKYCKTHQKIKIPIDT